MQELFENVREVVKETAKAQWKIALQQKNPVAAANTLNNFITSSKDMYTEEEIEFLRFYFALQMEMIKE